MTERTAADGAPRTITERSRRNLLAGAAGALGVLAVESVVRGAPAQAADGDALILGVINMESTQTVLTNTTSNHSGLAVFGNGDGAGIAGESDSGTGVLGLSTSGDAVLGTTAGTANAVHGQNTNSGAQGTGVFGEHTGGGTGILGQTNSTGHSGVEGKNLGTGPGVSGTGGVGVAGVTFVSTGAGVQGVTNAKGGMGVGAFTNVAGGIALGVFGPATFSLSGLASIAAGQSSVIVTGVSIRTGSLVLATAQNNAGVPVASAVPNVSGSKITINLTKAVPAGKTAKVAWFVVN